MTGFVSFYMFFFQHSLSKLLFCFFVLASVFLVTCFSQLPGDPWMFAQI